MIDSTISINIERAVLSSFLFNYDGFDEIVNYLQKEDFYLPAHSLIYKAMQELHNENMPLDEEFIRKKISNSDVDDSIFIEILSANPISNTSAYIQEIKEGARKRKLITLATTIKKYAIEDSMASTEAISIIKEQLESIDNQLEIIDDFTGQEIIETQFKKVPKYMTGINAIDIELDGIQNGQLIYVTGLEETGKTHITYKIMENISFARNVGIASLEFGKEKLKDRLSNMIRNNHSLTPKNIKVSFNCHNINILEKTVKKWATEGGKFIVIDSINLIENPLIKDRWERVLNIGTRLFKLVQQLEITMFVISTSTKEDNKSGNPSIYGGQLLNNYCDQKWHIFRDFETEDRCLWINKNKQNFKYPKINLVFAKDGNINGKDEYNKNYNKEPIQVIFESKNEDDNLDSSFDVSQFDIF